MTSLLRVSFIAALLGGLAATGGLAIEEWNVDHHGAEYSSYQFHWLTLGALPGMLITADRHGSDFQLGEIMQHRRAVIGWNSVVYAVLSASAFALFRIVARKVNTQEATITKLPNKSRHIDF
ncbi:MAG: hypothetical protein N2C12_08435 [Planctomycetales bacterium]